MLRLQGMLGCAGNCGLVHGLLLEFGCLCLRFWAVPAYLCVLYAGRIRGEACFGLLVV